MRDSDGYDQISSGVETLDLTQYVFQTRRLILPPHLTAAIRPEHLWLRGYPPDENSYASSTYLEDPTCSWSQIATINQAEYNTGIESLTVPQRRWLAITTTTTTPNTIMSIGF
jgi:hypothetical protein